jgi:hypothetical protein
MIIKPALEAHARRRIAQFHREHRYTRTTHIGASEIGSCLRRIKFAKVSAIPVEGWGASQRGNTFEDHYWTPAMRRHYGEKLLYTGKQQTTLTYGQLRATPDGLLIKQPRDALKGHGIADIGPSREIVLDCKSIDPRINLATPKPEHEFQIQVQMALLRLTTKHHPDYGVISYVNASFFDDVVEFAVHYDPDVYEQAKQRASLVFKAKLPVELLPEGWIAGGKECEYCPFAVPCQELRGDVPVQKASATPTDNMATGVLEKLMELAREERRLNAMAGGYEDEQRKMQHEIKQVLRAHGLNRIAHGGISIVWSPVKGRPAFDMPQLKAAATKLGLDIQQFETVGQPTDRLTVTIRDTTKSTQTNKRK